jgi:integrase
MKTPARPRIPACRYHRARGLAVVTVRDANGKRRDVYLGKWKSPEAASAYARIIGELASPRPTLAARIGTSVSIAEVMLAFLKHADAYYRRPDGTPTHEAVEFRVTFRVLRELYCHTPADKFGPLDLGAVRTRMIAMGWCRTLINRRISRIRRLFAWAVANQIVPPNVLVALRALDGLRVGRSVARETEPVKPVPMAVVEATLPFLSRQVAGLVRFQLFTGCRPGEACGVRRCEIDSSGPVWFYSPSWHKLAYRNKPRTIAIGPQAQTVLAEFPTFDPTAYVFNPSQAVAEFHAGRSDARITPLYPSHAMRNETKRVRVGKRPPGSRYTTASYGAAIRKAALKAGVEPWHPNQLRHAFATRVRQEHGLEAAQVALGHARADVTQIYAEKNQTLAAEVAALVG